MRPLNTSIGFVALLLIAAPVLSTPALLGSAHYQGPGVVVGAVDANGFPVAIVDNGAVECHDTNADGIPDHGIGGGCIRFQDLAGDSIYVHDASVPDDKLAFQVCVDANGDGICGGGGRDGAISEPCADIIIFSHRTGDGANFNPLYVHPELLKAMWQSCGQLGFPGYVVITCAGAHVHTDTPASSHTHHVTEGLATGFFTGGTPSGDFCGAPTAAKAYIVR